MGGCADRSYERSAIQSWLANHDTSPLSGQTLAHTMLTPNNRLKALIDELAPLVA